MHKSSFDNMRKFRDNYLESFQSNYVRILDVGSQDINGSYKPLFNNNSWEYKGLDICRGSNVDIIVKSIYDWKEIRSSSFDVVISGQAFEHIEFVWLTMYEISRALKNGGLCCIIAPSSGPEHRFPVDCWRFFPDGLKTLARYAMLDTLESYICSEISNDGEENIWKDAVLICRKPIRRIGGNGVFYLRNSILKLVSIRTPLNAFMAKLKR
jgi:SAM-dependent methyltransferase